MSSQLVYGLTSLQQSNYATLAVLTAVGYDYVLTFPDEVRYIWSKPWTWVSTLFIFVRYLGLLNLITCSLLGSSFLPGPTKVCEIVYTIDMWTYNIFLGAADLVMMLRVWAMYNRSRLILAVLLILFFLEIIPSILYAVIDSNPKNLSAPVIQITDFSYCLVLPIAVWTDETAAFQITHGAVMCTLAIFQFVGQLLQMYSATKQWQISQYLKLIVKQGIIYFFAIFLFNLMEMLAVAGEFPTGGWQMILSIILEYVPIFTLTPRFILSIRELYARDVESRCVGRWSCS
ncbi:hypothetical protein L210DRAFT_3202434 [Boletus edulis BED1]|uniref:DUF6533 domain-containing protein n=1 Tax=Boletus edulis BED1 TaxID=1328754 RepID=A0AAD4BXE4_BOLED|nr:hypothetical protein L210DRAFT_3202434 [Boletus edulis BED1]